MLEAERDERWFLNRGYRQHGDIDNTRGQRWRWTAQICRDSWCECERVDGCAALTTGKPARAINPDGLLENWRAETALFLLSRR